MIEKRRVLAPHIVPAAGPTEGPLYYLSWPGWELYLRRRLGINPAPNGPRPILLPSQEDAETDFKAIDQLNTTAAQMGANFFSLAAESPESLPAILGGIRAYQAPKSPAPILDDRAYLALWAISERQAQQSEKLLAQARTEEQKMWAALKGEDFSEPRQDAPAAPADIDSRTLYALRAWERLAGEVLTADDTVISSIPTLPRRGRCGRLFFGRFARYGG